MTEASRLPIKTPERPDEAQTSLEYVSGILPAGALLPYAGSVAPRGFLLCDGAAVNRLQYRELFLAIGTTYGVGDGATTFNVPDLRGRVPLGVDGTAGRITANDAMGNAAGSETIAAGDLPSHSHPIGGSTGGEAAHSHGVNINSGIESAGHGHTNPNSNDHGAAVYGGFLGNWGAGTFNTLNNPDTNHAHNVNGNTGAGSSHSHSLPANTGNTGGAAAGTKLPPYQVVQYLIKF